MKIGDMLLEKEISEVEKRLNQFSVHKKRGENTSKS